MENKENQEVETKEVETKETKEVETKEEKIEEIKENETNKTQIKEEVETKEEKVDTKALEKKFNIEKNNAILDVLLEKDGLDAFKGRIKVNQDDTKETLIKKINDYKKEVTDLYNAIPKANIPDTNISNKEIKKTTLDYMMDLLK